MKSLAVLEYMFMFEPNSTWKTGLEFEKDLADYFTMRGYEAEIIESRGGSMRRILYIHKVEREVGNTDRNSIQSKMKMLQKGVLK